LLTKIAPPAPVFQAKAIATARLLTTEGAELGFAYFLIRIEYEKKARREAGLQVLIRRNSSSE
jgi:hypothetical protein